MYVPPILVDLKNVCTPHSSGSARLLWHDCKHYCTDRSRLLEESVAGIKSIIWMSATLQGEVILNSNVQNLKVEPNLL
jgi:hypothetical protein